jgi:hypothetical protein
MTAALSRESRNTHEVNFMRADRVVYSSRKRFLLSVAISLTKGNQEGIVHVRLTNCEMIP